MRARRRFLKALAAAPLAPSALLAAEVAPRAPQAAPAPPAPPPAPAAAGAAAPGPAARALGEAVRHRYGAQLEAADFEEIDKAIEANLQAADRLKAAIPLGNADEPVTLFAARPPAPVRRPAPARSTRG